MIGYSPPTFMAIQNVNCSITDAIKYQLFKFSTVFHVHVRQERHILTLNNKATSHDALEGPNMR